MSVVKSERSTSEMEFLHTARELEIYTIRRCVNIPKRYTFYLGQKIAEISTHIYNCVVCANSIFPQNQHEAQIRRDYLIHAVSELHALVAQIEIASEIIGLDADKMHAWMDRVNREIRLVKGLMKKDKERYRDLK